ncbi:MAG: AbrB/MazE/SpoVT family DNA-binding domain-containing protein [bacterium]
MSVHTLIVNSNGQITIPAKYRKTWGLKSNTKIKVKITKNKGFIILDNHNYTLDDLPQIVGKLKHISSKKIEQELSGSFKPTKI